VREVAQAVDERIHDVLESQNCCRLMSSL
jgi:hypothetical protein